jgi:hypothetical protein
MVSIVAFQAVDPSSILGRRMFCSFVFCFFLSKGASDWHPCQDIMSLLDLFLEQLRMGCDARCRCTFSLNSSVERALD